MSARAAAIAAAGGAWLVMAGLSAQSAPAQTTADASRFPAGVGRDALFKVCQDCHGPERVLAHLKTRAEWIKTLDEMAANGAAGSDQEWTAILEYLVKHRSPVMINTAAAKEIESALDIPAAAAEAIVSARPIASLDALMHVRGVEPARIEAHKDRLIF